MRSREIMHLSGMITAAILLSMLLAGRISGAPASTCQGDASTAVGRLRSMAEAQHEIVIILIKKKEYEKAAAEANKIFDMKWPADQESLLLDELLILTNQFQQHGQAALGVRLIDRNLKYFKRASSQATLQKELGYLHKSLNQNDQAIECFRKAMNLEGAK